MKHWFSAITLALCTLTPTLAQDANPPPGEYLSGHGRLLLSTGKGGALQFTLDSVGANGHSCQLDGTIQKSRALLTPEKDSKPCEVRFKNTGKGIDVSSNNAESCRYFCGMRAAFEDVYLQPAPGCRMAEVKKTRQEFKRHYDRKAFAEARAALEPILANCAPTLDWLDIAWIRNDLALSQHKAGDSAACRATLEPLAKDAAGSDDDIRNNYPPTDAESYLPAVRATRTNLKLCKSAKP